MSNHISIYMIVCYIHRITALGGMFRNGKETHGLYVHSCNKK